MLRSSTTFGKFVKHVRVQRQGMSVADLAVRSHVTENTILHVEGLQLNVDMDTAGHIASGLGYSLGEFMTEAELFEATY